MNKLVSTIIIGVLFLLPSAAMAQGWEAGASVTYGLKEENVGANIRAYRLFQPNFNLGGELSYLFPQESEANGKFLQEKYIEYALLMHFPFAFKNYRLYPLVGGSIVTRLRKSTDIRGSDHDRLSKGGILLGGGVGYQANAYTPFVEIRHRFGDFGQTQIFVGTTIKIKPRETP